MRGKVRERVQEGKHHKRGTGSGARPAAPSPPSALVEITRTSWWVVVSERARLRLVAAAELATACLARSCRAAC